MKSNRPILEPLEARIAPAGLLPTDPNAYVKATLGGPNLVHAGQVLTTGSQDSGSYLLFVEKGDAFVFFTDLNNNRQVDFNELTGIAAGDGLQLVSFVDIHGDIVTNLKKTTAVFPGGVSKTTFSLTDSNSTSADDAASTGGDGRVLLNNTIERIELRSLTPADVGDLNHDGTADAADVAIHQTITTTSIFGNIYAGRGFGTADGANGLVIDPTAAVNFGFAVKPTIGSIKTGTAANGEYFSFGASNLDDINGYFVPFTPGRGQVGGDINGIHVVGAGSTLNLDTIHAGDGGIGARGGNVSNVVIPMDDSGGYSIIAGNGGNGPSGGDGGSILNFSDLGSITGHVMIKSGDGGIGTTGRGGNGGNFTFGTFNVRAEIDFQLGSGGTGFIGGGNGASLTKGNFTQPDDSVPIVPGNAVGMTHVASSAPLQVTELIHGTASNHETQNFVLPPTDFYTLTFNGQTTAPLSQQADQQTVQDALNSLTSVSNIGGVSVTFANGGFNVTFNALGDQPSLVGYRTPVIATQQGLDFDHDGNGDLVYTTLGTSQLVVRMGDASGGFGSRVFNLSGVRSAEALVVADLNGDGHPDIAVGSQDDGSQEGVVVFLSRYDSNDHFIGFYDARFSVLPQLQSFDPKATGQNGNLTFVKSPNQISSISAGDFNGDGKIELAVVETQYNNESTDTNAVVTKLDKPDQVVLFLQPDVERDNVTGKSFFTGQFYADFGTKGFDSNGNTVGIQPKFPVVDLSPIFMQGGAGTTGTIVADSSPLQNGSSHDVFFASGVGSKTVVTIDYSVQSDVPGNRAPLPVLKGSFALGTLDSDRQTGANHNTNLDMTMQDFAITDLNGDGKADLVAISPTQYLVAVLGDGQGNGSMVGSGQDNAGTFFGPPANGTGGYNLVTAGNLLSVRVVDGDHNGKANEVYVLDDANNNGTRVSLIDRYNGAPQTGNNAEGTLAPNPEITGLLQAPTQKDVAFTLHYEHTDDVYHSTGVDPVAADLAGDDNLYVGSFTHGSVRPEQVIPLNHTAFSVKTGDGGSSLLGSGGRGGTLGGGSLTKSASSVTGVLNFTYAGDLVFQAGRGGDGFAAGGQGGDVAGIVVRYRGGADIGLSVEAIGGDGGRGVTAAGGNGGTLRQNSFQTSLAQVGAITSGGNSVYVVQEFAGNGGNGAVGGQGGSIIGNGGPNSFSYDTLSIDVVAQAGNGGDGTKSAGAGGAISGFHPTIPPPKNTTGSIGGAGTVAYIAGAGGRGVAGHGGNGGSISNSNPDGNAFIDNTVTLIGGDAGDGLTGGNGGIVTGFNLQLSSISLSPRQVTVHGGNGGLGSAGAGGSGGGVSNVIIPSRGTAGLNSVLAGNGGDSAGNIGGNGGTIAGIRVQSTQGAVAVAAGAGGNGLLRGGNGGSDFNVTVETGASTQSKVLVIAGAGGDASAFIPNVLDPSPNQAQKAFGGTVGRGGNGGNINGLFQPAGNTGAHFDVIAGNGGSSKNYGTLFDPKNFVGSGGSVSNVSITGDFGNISQDNPDTQDNPFTINFLENNENVPIKSYNDAQSGETIAQFVTNNLRNNSVALTDALGNVGIVVGAAGRAKAVVLDPIDKPETYTAQAGANFPSNGALVNVTGRDLLAAVAGSVDAIASIRVVQDLFIANNVGSDKGVFEIGTDGQVTLANLAVDLGRVGVKDYLDKDGMVQGQPMIGGKLIDGAVVADVYLPSKPLPPTSGWGYFTPNP